MGGGRTSRPPPRTAAGDEVAILSTEVRSVGKRQDTTSALARSATDSTARGRTRAGSAEPRVHVGRCSGITPEERTPAVASGGCVSLNTQPRQAPLRRDLVVVAADVLAGAIPGTLPGLRRGTARRNALNGSNPSIPGDIPRAPLRRGLVDEAGRHYSIHPRGHSPGSVEAGTPPSPRNHLGRPSPGTFPGLR